MVGEPDPSPDGGAAGARAAAAARIGANDARESPLMVSIAWSLVAIADELKMIRQEMHRQARAGGRRG
jgi:hypothetical protein